MPEKMLPAVQCESRKKTPPTQRAGARRRSPRSGSAAAGAHIAREAGRCAPIAPAVSGGQGIRHAIVTPSATWTRGVGGRRGCRGACPSHPLPPAAQATTPRCRAEATSQRPEKSLVSVKTEKVTFYRSKGNLHAGEDAPCLSTRKPKKSHQPSEPGRGGDPRIAGAPQQARISPAKREDARRLAPCGERRTGNTTCDSDALHHTDKGSTGVVGGVEGLAPLTPCPSPGGDHARMPGNSRQPATRKEEYARREATTPGCRAEAAIQRQERKYRAHLGNRKSDAFRPCPAPASAGAGRN